MTTSFMSAPKLLLTSESVTEGHPDKLCDQVSDAVLDAVMAKDPEGRVACETATTTGLIFVIGEITTSHRIDYDKIVRQVVQDAGYTKAEYCFDYRTCGVMVSVKEQSPDIASAVNNSKEVRSELSADEMDGTGAGDQGMMVGFAAGETPELMPLPIVLAHRLCRRLAQVRKEGIVPYLRPDGKSQVTVEYSYGVPRRVDTIVVSTQHDDAVDLRVLQRDVSEEVIKAVIPSYLLDEETKVLINPSGNFAIGGPMGDAGMTGRKIIVDTYGGVARHGGGCFSGKDPTKVDRSGAYAARYVAKNIVAAGLADRVEIQVSYAIGQARPVSVSLESFGTNKVPDELILRLIEKHFDLRPAAIIQTLRLRRPIFRPTAVYGHFGRDDIDAPWEITDKAELLRTEAGLAAIRQQAALR